MRIVHICNTRIPSEKAHSRQIIEMAYALQQQTNSILIINNRVQENKSLKKIQYTDFYNIPKLNIKILNIFDDIYLNKKIGFSSTLYIFRIILTFIKLLPILNKNNDIIYSRELLLSIFLNIFKYKTIFEIHQFGTDEMKKKTFNFLFKINFFFTKKKLKIIAISNNLKQKIINNSNSFYFEIFVLHDAYRKIIKSSTYYEKLEFDFCYCGQLFEEKGIKLIIELAGLNKKFNFILIGGLDSQVNFWSEVANKKKINNVNFLGFKSPKEIPFFINKSKILLLPQINDKAESPLKLFEYLSYGKPIVSSSTKPITEILINKYNSLLFEPGNLKDFDRVVKKYFYEENLLTEISKNALITSKKYTWNNRAKKIIEIIKKDLN